MNTREALRKTLARINGKGYKAYKDIESTYDYGNFILSIDHVQGDPFASPSRVRGELKTSLAGFPRGLWKNHTEKVALADYLSRQFSHLIRKTAKGHRGMGKSGLIAIDSGGQEILERNAVVVTDEMIEVRFVVGLPASGRTILGLEAIAMFFQEIPAIIEKSLFLRNVNLKELRLHIETANDQDYLRGRLDDLGLVAFVANGSILPRRSGIDPRPLVSKPIPFRAPQELEVEAEVPYRGCLKGMGIPKGVTLIVGGGFHGKSTLLNALKMGIYSQIPGDGREFVVTHEDAVKIRAEDGRNVEKVNITAFIDNLPFRRDTLRFSTENASGSTSQAANIMEALEVGARVLLIDEDTSATNFMVRDERMQELVAKDREPITPFIDKVGKLYKDLGVSTVLVMGGSGDYFDVADTVIIMDNYLPLCGTHKAKEVAKKHALKRIDEGGPSFGDVTPRRMRPESFSPSRGRRDVKIDARGREALLFGDTVVDLSLVEQLTHTSQTRCIGLLIHYYLKHRLHQTSYLREGLQKVMQDVSDRGLDILTPYKAGNLAKPRIHELAAAINRMRTLKVE
jgi:predicted ABC-class ATPase